MPQMRIGFALSGSFCTFERALAQMRKLAEDGYSLMPIQSFCAATTDTRFGTAEKWQAAIKDIAGCPPLCTLTEVEPIGPKGLLDVLVVMPCTGTTLAKLANGISDTPVTLAVKSHLRRSRPVVIAISTNDAMGASFRNIALLKNTKHLYFVPFRQDDVSGKPNSLVADFSLLPATIQAAMEGQQLQPLLIP